MKDAGVGITSRRAGRQIGSLRSECRASSAARFSGVKGVWTQQNRLLVLEETVSIL